MEDLDRPVAAGTSSCSMEGILDTQAVSCVAKALVDPSPMAGLTAAEGLGRRP